MPHAQKEVTPSGLLTRSFLRVKRMLLGSPKGGRYPKLKTTVPVVQSLDIIKILKSKSIKSS
jgi:hypothetical protein